ncbi:hypothetical protein IOD06_00340 [Psychrobacter sp. N25K4-3-2]|uniref:hypothetical protein n=1 Tax=Psychrobacter sp. N25K4-3-2 TaxID=2785026 RepID=UPI00188DAE9B|nr:hypothetical protein [Psychrobacter sp. N25K4-3-2]MBF4488336.1 hypothetical protein [Psychrobacter sp. N25K4-3-2]
MLGKTTQKELQPIDNFDEQPEIHQHPMICLFDFEDDVHQELKRLKFNCVKGSFGSSIRVNNQQHATEKLMKLNYNSPKNLHEFDIVMLDMTGNIIEDFSADDHSLENSKGSKAYAFLSCFPEQVFDPRPIAINFISNEIEEIIKKKSIVIAFCGQENTVDYEFVEITSHGYAVKDKRSYSNLYFYSSIASRSERNGNKSIIVKGNKISPILEKYIDGIEYSSVFYHPTEWKDGKSQKIEEFIPLLFNDREEIISYAHWVGDCFILVFPDIQEKSQFISEIFKIYLPEIMPDIFPYHGEFGWLHNGEYLLPNEGALLKQKLELGIEYKKNLQNIEQNIEKTRDQYSFLHELIYQTGDDLVKSIEKYMVWLGFDSVVDMDEKVIDLFEEDLQIETDEGLLVIEIKGIGGTSTDKACSQISKIKYRRAEQRGRFDVFGLYIVNHQRYLAPKNRKNPPFTENQINDAKLDKRGLITTYNLYKAYFLIEDGIITKEEVRYSLFNFGLITLEPSNTISIGISNEVFNNGKVAIINLTDTCTIKIGSTLIGKKDGKLSKLFINSIQINGSNVDEATIGEVGIALNLPIKKGTELFLREA